MDESEHYQFLRALLEDAVASWPAGVNEDIRTSIQVYLRTHCRDCGAVISEPLRRISSTRCAWCSQPTRQAIRRGLEGEEDDDEVPFR